MAEILRYAAFSDTPVGGNPAGVVLDATDLDDDRMQAIAAEVGYSETAFAVPRGDGRFGLRFFSPLAEVAFCGHATIATAVAIAERTAPGTLIFDTPAGEIPIGTGRDAVGLRATLRSVATSSTPADPATIEQTLEALRWPATDLDHRYPPHVAFGGNQHLVLAAATRARLADLDYDFDRLRSVMTARGWTTVQLFWRQDAETIHCRDPFPVGGVVEDPATGAAAAALGGYLRAIEPADAARRLTLIQGEDMGRRSELLVDIPADDPRISVSGRAVRIAG